MLKSIAIGLAVLLLCVLTERPATAQAAMAAGDLDGAWTITKGVDAGKKKYTGAVYLGTALVDGPVTSYDATWNIGADTYVRGVAWERDNTVWASFGGDRYGAGYFEWSDGTLMGKFGMLEEQYAPVPAVQKGTRISKKKGKWEGSFTFNGVAAEADRVVGSLTVKKVGSTYALTWDFSGQVTQGIGIEQDKMLLVAWGEGAFGLATYKQSKNGKTLDGKWMIKGGKKLGTEVLTRGAPPAPVADPSDPSGTWTIKKGVDPGGNKYRGKVHFAAAITDGTTHSYDVTWTTGKANTEIRGAAWRRGNTVWAGFGGDRYGVGYYEWGDGKLLGKFAILDQYPPIQGVQRGTLTTKKKGKWEGTFALNGVEAEADKVIGSLTVKKLGKAYALTWKFGEQVTQGIGLEQGKMLLVAWGEGAYGLASYQLSKNGKKLEGTWVINGGKKLGTEGLTR